jgi:HAD superfamily hydrolase (TIGR01549 family)
MDGTLTRPTLDFDQIRSEIGITGPIIEAIRRLPADRAERANAILHRHEYDAAVNSTLNDACRDVLAMLRNFEIPTAIVTRNSLANTRIVLRRHDLSFDLLVTREDVPEKPHPQSVLRCCDHFGVEPTDTWFIGDGHHDIEAGNAAGVSTIWLSHRRPRDFDAVPAITIDSLADVVTMLQSPSA